MADAHSPRSAPARLSDRTSSTTPLPVVSKRRALLELAIGYGLILLVLWTPRPYQRFLYTATLFVLIAIIGRSFTSFNSSTVVVRGGSVTAIALVTTCAAANVVDDAADGIASMQVTEASSQNAGIDPALGTAVFIGEKRGSR